MTPDQTHIFGTTAREARELLESSGFTVLTTKSYRVAQARQSTARMQVYWAEKDGWMGQGSVTQHLQADAAGEA